MFAAGLGAWIVYGPTRNTAHASDTGFSLTMAGMPIYIFMLSRKTYAHRDIVGFSGMILWWVRNFNDFEVSGMCFEYLVLYSLTNEEMV